MDQLQMERASQNKIDETIDSHSIASSAAFNKSFIEQQNQDIKTKAKRESVLKTNDVD